MSAPVVFTDAVLYLGGYDLTAASNQVAMPLSRAELPDPRFGDTMVGIYPGVLKADITAKGVFDSALDGPLFTKLDTVGPLWPFSIMPLGGAYEALAYMLEGRAVGYAAMSGRWGESLPYDLSVKPGSTARLGRGKVLYPYTSLGGSATSTKKQLGAIPSGYSLMVFLHAFSATGTPNWAIDVRSDADAPAGGETVRGSFADIVATGPQSQRILVAGPITDSWWDVDVVRTGGTALVLAVTAAIIPS